jgi:hypothetical protein
MRGTALFALAIALVPVSTIAAGPAARTYPTPRAPEPKIDIHVNRVALDSNSSKSAIVEIDQPKAEASFTVLRDGRTVLTSALKPLPAFDAWGYNRHYYLADFSKLTEPGEYMLRVNLGPYKQETSAIRVGPNAQFETLASAVLDYFKQSRWPDEGDGRRRLFGSDRFVDVRGGWQDAGGDTGKYLSHLSYANYFNPQQAGFAAWALARAHEAAPGRFAAAGLDAKLIDESFWGADFLHRLLSPEGFFSMTVFDGWGHVGAERQVVGYVGERGEFTKDYEAGMREGAGVAIAALARAARLARDTKRHGAFDADTYLADARRGFAHLKANNLRYLDDHRENIIDDYCALLAAVELFKTTREDAYLKAASARATHLADRLTEQGWWRSDDGTRPFYHAADAGLPILVLTEYLGIAPDTQKERIKAVIARAIDAQQVLDHEVENVFDYPRQIFRTSINNQSGPITAGFFMPHANETGYWWQGEDARLASLAAATTLGARAIGRTGETFGIAPELATSVQHRFDWILGRNPYDVSMVYGFGGRNPNFSGSGGHMLVGGISNGITGGVGADDGAGIDFAAGPDSENWRWNEQWIPHDAWMLLALSVTAAE